MCVWGHNITDRIDTTKFVYSPTFYKYKCLYKRTKCQTVKLVEKIITFVCQHRIKTIGQTQTPLYKPMQEA